jgi:hypothetical protein
MAALQLLAALVAAGLLALVLVHLRLAWPLLCRQTLAAAAGGGPLPGGWPSAEVILCLRGADPALRQLLQTLADQAYGGPWRLQVVVDSRQDSAWPVVEAALEALASSAQWQHASLETLANPAAAASRKCAALLQGFAALDPATEVVALVDGDAVIGSDWLAALVTGCRQPEVGAGSGHRWYAPAGGSPVGQVRAIWNAGALLLMTHLQVPWGGSLALRREVIANTGWADRLRSSLCEDTALLEPLQRAGWRFQPLPQLLSCDRQPLGWDELIGLWRWISRQLLLVRLHHPGWWWLALHAALTSLLPALALLLLLLPQLPAGSRALLLTALVATDLLWVGVLIGLSRALAQPQPERLVALPLWVALTQVVYGLATLRAATAHQVSWRGVSYTWQRSKGGWKVSVLQAPGAVLPRPRASWLR